MSRNAYRMRVSSVSNLIPPLSHNLLHPSPLLKDPINLLQTQPPRLRHPEPTHPTNNEATRPKQEIHTAARPLQEDWRRKRHHPIDDPVPAAPQTTRCSACLQGLHLARVDADGHGPGARVHEGEEEDEDDDEVAGGAVVRVDGV